MAAQSFTLFLKLPAEIQDMVWEFAHEQPYWTASKLDSNQRAGHVVLPDRPRPPVALACKDSSYVLDRMRATRPNTPITPVTPACRHFYELKPPPADRPAPPSAVECIHCSHVMAGLPAEQRYTIGPHSVDDNGNIAGDPNQHIFFLFHTILYRNRPQLDILPQIRHIVLSPMLWSHLWNTMDLLVERCRNLKTIIVFGPWHEPFTMPRIKRAELMTGPEGWAVQSFFAVRHDAGCRINWTKLIELCSQFKSAADEKLARYERSLEDAASAEKRFALKIEGMLSPVDLSRHLSQLRGFVERIEPAPPALILCRAEDFKTPYTHPMRAVW